jgi:hypothetical protein
LLKKVSTKKVTKMWMKETRTISYCFWSYVGIEPVASARALVALASNTESSFRVSGERDGRAFAASTLESRSSSNI